MKETRSEILTTIILGCLHCPNPQTMNASLYIIADVRLLLRSPWDLAFNKSPFGMPNSQIILDLFHLIIKQKKMDPDLKAENTNLDISCQQCCPL